MGAAIGAAVAGMRPVAEIMLMNFLAVAMDQLFNHAAKLRFMSGGQTTVPLTVRTVTGAGAGFGAQHSDMIEAWLAHTPGLKVVMASNPAEAYGLLLSCIFDDDPRVYIEHSLLSYMNTGGAAPVRGGAHPVRRGQRGEEGTDVSVIGYGKPIIDAREASPRQSPTRASASRWSTCAPSHPSTGTRRCSRWRRRGVLSSSTKQSGLSGSAPN